ncbi:MAG TPA: tetraacyldisaccharide 4'-kinase, partial [Gemmatimonadota bacterium]|nr:tetraacyldisaccharide 4'-kinase [Gemmatimonadota bacterium]
RPESAAELARARGLDVSALEVFPDHHAYSAEDIARLRASHPGAAFVMTAKDAIKVDVGWFGDARVGVLVRRLEPQDPELLRSEIADAIAWRP